MLNILEKDANETREVESSDSTKINDDIVGDTVTGITSNIYRNVKTVNTLIDEFWINTNKNMANLDPGKENKLIPIYSIMKLFSHN